MTKEQFEDLVLLSIGKNDPQFKIHRNTISALAQTKVVEIINEMKNAFMPIPSSFYSLYSGTLVKGLVSFPIANLGSLAIRSLKVDGYFVSVIANESEVDKYLAVDESERMAWVESGGIATFGVDDGSVKAYIIPDIIKMDSEDEMFGDELQSIVMQKIKQELGLVLQLPEDRVNNG